MKEMGAVKVAHSGTDMLQHETAGANLVESHMLFIRRSFNSQSARGGSQIIFIFSLNRASISRQKLKEGV